MKQFITVFLYLSFQCVQVGTWNSEDDFENALKKAGLV